MSILKYFKLAKPTDDHLPDLEGILSSKLPSSANSEVHCMIDSDCHLPYSNTCIYSLFGTALPHRLLSAKLTINCVEKFAKLSSAKLTSLLIPQTLMPPNFHRLQYKIYIITTLTSTDHLN